MDKEKALQKIEKLIQEGNDVLTTKFHEEAKTTQACGVSVCYIPTSGDYVDPGKFNSCREKINNFLHSNDLFNASLESFKKEFTFNTNYEYIKWYIDVLKALKENIEDDIIKLPSSINETNKENVGINNKNCVFIGHGHHLFWARIALHMLDDLKVQPLYYESECRTGKSIDNTLESFSQNSNINFAILILMKEDETKVGESRARQNVIHELGIFREKLGSEKVAIIIEKGIERPSNTDGIEYIEYSGDECSVFYRLDAMFRREGIIK